MNYVETSVHKCPDACHTQSFGFTDGINVKSSKQQPTVHDEWQHPLAESPPPHAAHCRQYGVVWHELLVDFICARDNVNHGVVLLLTNPLASR